MSQPDMEYPCQSFNLKGDGGKEVIKLAASIVCLTKPGPKDTEKTEDLKKKSTIEPVKKQSSVEPVKKQSTTDPVSIGNSNF